jgi:hypothetical protein
MAEFRNPIENELGVDISQIRSQLSLSVAERVRQMVTAANVLLDIQENVRQGRNSQAKIIDSQQAAD